MLKKIVLIEDNEDDIFFIRRALSLLITTCTLDIFRSGPEALDYLDIYHAENNESFLIPDLIFLDIKLPQNDGLQVLKIIRSNEITHKIPVLVLTSSSEERDIRTSLRLGANGYIVKPTDTCKYIETIIKVTS